MHDDVLVQLLVVAVFSRHAEAIAWGRARLEEDFGPVCLDSKPFPFRQTRYYEPTMGTDLQKQFLVFSKLQPPGDLARIKRRTIDLEQQVASSGRFPEVRPLNLDP